MHHPAPVDFKRGGGGSPPLIELSTLERYQQQFFLRLCSVRSRRSRTIPTPSEFDILGTLKKKIPYAGRTVTIGSCQFLWANLSPQ